MGAVYIATKSFPASRAATLIGATQMFGMAGGSAGQFVVGPVIARRRPLEPLLARSWAWPASSIGVAPLRPAPQAEEEPTAAATG